MLFSLLCLGVFGMDSTVLSIPTDTNDRVDQSLPDATEQLQNRPVKTITSYSVHTMDSLSKVEQHIQVENYDSAEKTIEELRENEAELSLSEKADVEYMSSRIAHARQNIEATIGFLESVLEYRDNISYTREEEVLLRISELYLSEKQHAKAVARMNEWLKIVEEPQARELAFAGSVFLRVKSFKRAKALFDRAIEQQEEKGEEVDARWTSLLDYIEKQLDASK